MCHGLFTSLMESRISSAHPSFGNCVGCYDGQDFAAVLSRCFFAFKNLIELGNELTEDHGSLPSAITLQRFCGFRLSLANTPMSSFLRGRKSLGALRTRR